MTDVATWLLEHGEQIGSRLILLALAYAFMTGNLWSKRAVEKLIADFEKREAKQSADHTEQMNALRKDCEYSRIAHERVLGELERTITANKLLVEKVKVHS